MSFFSLVFKLIQPTSNVNVLMHMFVQVQFMVPGENGRNGLNVPRAVGLEELRIESGTVTRLLQLMEEKSARGNILTTGFVTI